GPDESSRVSAPEGCAPRKHQPILHHRRRAPVYSLVPRSCAPSASPGPNSQCTYFLNFVTGTWGLASNPTDIFVADAPQNLSDTVASSSLTLLLASLACGGAPPLSTPLQTRLGPAPHDWGTGPMPRGRRRSLRAVGTDRIEQRVEAPLLAHVAVDRVDAECCVQPLHSCDAVLIALRLQFFAQGLCLGKSLGQAF